MDTLDFSNGFTSLYFWLTGAIGILLIAIIFKGYTNKSESDEKIERNEKINEDKPTKLRKDKKIRQSRDSGKVAVFSHPWLSTNLKAHSQPITDFDFSLNGKYAITCAGDRTALIWPTKEFERKEHKPIRANISLDHATRVRFSPDGRAFLVALGSGNTIRIYKMGKKDDGGFGNITPVEGDFPQKSIEDIINVGISCNGKFIMSAYRDTKIIIWDLKGQVLDTIDTHQVNNNYACVSPCGRFVASCGFTPDVKVWEVSFTKAGDFREVSRAFELKGHTAGVYSFSFTLDSSKMASVSKDGTWKLWNTNIEYEKNQDPYLLLTGDFKHNQPSIIALSSTTSCVAISCGKNLYIFDTDNGELVEEMCDVHSQAISCVRFSPDDAYILTSGDKHVRVLHNVHGFRTKLRALAEKLKTTAANLPLKQRLEEQIKETQNHLDNILGDREHSN